MYYQIRIHNDESNWFDYLKYAQHPHIIYFTIILAVHFAN